MRLQSENIDGIKAIVNETNARHFHVVIDGPGGVSLNITKLLHFITFGDLNAAYFATFREVLMPPNFIVLISYYIFVSDFLLEI